MLTSALASLTALASVSGAGALVATDVIRAGDMVTLSNVSTEESFETDDEAMLGREARRTIYAGQEITFDNTRAPRLVRRNQVVTVKYINGPLEISTTGRAMGEAALHEPVSVLNLQSRQLVHGIVQESGWVLVQ
ncbi:MAG: flagellar basal body P-ring formation chaperone FlgA [Hyphomonadaceae bacterium]|nr:flagellar basal body P-ring formation chaperone FlgA [Hyphomonadaceae bacterium]